MHVRVRRTLRTLGRDTPRLLLTCAAFALLFILFVRQLQQQEREDVAGDISLEASEGDDQADESVKDFDATTGSWQAVAGTRDKFYVFSAFHDARGSNNLIRVIAATRTARPEAVACRFWYLNENGQRQSVSVPARVQAIRENWNWKYSATFVLCPLQPGQVVPEAVSVVLPSSGDASNFLKVLATQPENDNSANSLGVCVKPLHFDFNRVVEFVEFLELYSLLGVQHFTFYNRTTGPQVSCVLRDYIQRGLVTVLPWELDMKKGEIRTEGIFASLNDCLYRMMGRHALLALIDVDEYILPHGDEDTLPELLTSMGKSSVDWGKAGAFSFRNAFFYRQFPDDETVKSNSVLTHLVTMRKTSRRSDLHPHGQRSKYICVAQRVVEAGNHFVWQYLPGYKPVNVDPQRAMLHHYRVCEFGGSDCVQQKHEVDRTAHRYAGRLKERVAARWAALRQRCHLPDLVSPPDSAVF